MPRERKKYIPYYIVNFSNDTKRTTSNTRSPTEHLNMVMVIVESPKTTI